MTQMTLQALLKGAPAPLCALLDSARGALQAPVRAEVFGLQRFAQHGRSLGETHRSSSGRNGTAFFPRLRSNIRSLQEAQSYLEAQASTGYELSPAADWLLDNYPLIEAQLHEIRDGLAGGYFRKLPVLQDEPLAGLPRVYGIAWAFVAHTDGAFSEELLSQFLNAYQETRELSLGEMWALPTTLRVVLIENLRRLAERVATHQGAREAANLCCDKLDGYSTHTLDEVVARLKRRGVDRLFLAQMAQRLQDRHAPARNPARYADWLHSELPDLAAAQAQQSADQAADNLSVSNAVTSLRAIGDADWPEIIARSSTLMRLMLGCSVFASEDAGTRDQTLHAIERLALRQRRSEVQVAQALLDLMRTGAGAPALASHWLQGPGRAELLRALRCPERAGTRWAALARRCAPALYLGVLCCATLGLMAWLVLRHGSALGRPGAAPLLAGLALLFPASEAVVAVVNRLISESAPPQHLPRLALLDGIPAEHRVLVAIPGMLSNAAAGRELVHRLLLHFLANPEPQAQFALLSDWSDADTARSATDQPLLDDATRRVQQLNASYPQTRQGAAPRFILLHRERVFSVSEQRWIGWERKRGKLEQLVAALATGSGAAFLDLGETSRIASDTPYIVTLDSDTGLPPGRLRELVGVAAHPQNQPTLAPDGRSVQHGYGILQPHLSTPLPARKDFTFYHWLFAGQCGIDPYSAASSEVYQDLFGEGTFTGKGLLNVRAVHAVLGARLPPDQVLSHDLLEGSIARCAAVSDISVIEDAPFHADVAASRVHRWTRGDWQLLPFLLSPQRYRLRAINRWKMIDNLRRSLVAPMSLALLLAALGGVLLSPWAALATVLAAFSAGPLMGSAAGFWPARAGMAMRPFYRKAVLDLLRTLSAGLWLLGQLLQQSLLALDAVARALYRLAVSRRLLLQWTTAAAAAAQARTQLAAVARQHWKEPALALVLFSGFCFAVAPPARTLALALCALWAAAPIWTWCVSRAHPTHADASLPQTQQRYLQAVARDTWRFFERCVSAAEHHLPPDNLQTAPFDIVAHRTSPTNIGMYLLSASCARAFGWIGTQDLLARLEATLDTLVRLPRHRGHFLNWYDTQTCAALAPMYVSTVDSGNLSGHLLAVAQSCLELARSPHDAAASQRALQECLLRLDTAQLARTFGAESAIAQLLAQGPGLIRDGAPAAQGLLQAAADELAAQWPDLPQEPGGNLPAQELAWQLGDYLATLRSAWADVQANQAQGSALAVQRLHAAAAVCERLAWEADFAFLYHPKRRLLHIGFRVAEQQLDASFYDLLASESRLASLLAVAKGDAPVRHWAALGRPFFASAADAGLRSWSGSMFEYLMPGLVLDEPHGSVLHDAARAARREQIAFALEHELPWGVSECAYGARDDTLAYQYAPQGVPRLALRRTPSDELVVAPYATALAAQWSPRRACDNFAALQALGARARYGFIEALDFTASRQAQGQRCTPVSTFMAHHQGMSIVALANLLLGGVAQRWGMGNAAVEAVVSLLHERAPREVPAPLGTPLAVPKRAPQRRSATPLVREVRPGAGPLEPTHLLSNGRYSVALRGNGAGASRWGQIGLTRWRDDALRDAYGSFLYLRRDAATPAAQALFSITQHPAPDPKALYQCSFQADRVCFSACWPDLRVNTTVWVSPEDDIEFRQVELHNLGESELPLELISAFEVTLSEARADEAHPAFTNLFVRALWQAEQQALVFERTPRLQTEQQLLLTQFLCEHNAPNLELRLQTDRQRWLGRNQRASTPQAWLEALPSASPSTALQTGLDPVCVLAARLRLPPHGKVQLTFATAAAADAGTLHAVIDKYRQSSHVQRASLMSATLAAIRLRALRISAENFAAVQSLTTALSLCLTRAPADQQQAAPCDRRALWRLGISGDRPLLLVSADMAQSLGLMRTLAQALNLWTWAGVACDLVVLNAEPASYQMPVQREIALLRERFRQESAALHGAGVTGFHVLAAADLAPLERVTLQALARVWLHADGRPLVQHVQDWLALHQRDREQRDGTSSSVVAQPSARVAVLPASGEFAAGGEFRFDVGAGLRPQRPWINVLSNAGFGTQISESGAGSSWARNSRLNQLTAWSNDPVADPPGEWFLLQDMNTQRVWSVAPSAWADESVVYRVSHGQGYSLIEHRCGAVQVSACWSVDRDSAVKQVSIEVSNQGARTLRLRLTGMVEWMIGANRCDRASLHTALLCQRLPAVRDAAGVEQGRKLTALLATQCDRGGGFGEGTAFFGLASAHDEEHDWTCDRREFHDARGELVLPDHLGQAKGAGLDPCAALSMTLVLPAGAALQRVFLLGYADSADAARSLATMAAVVPAAQRLRAVRSHWQRLLGAIQVITPDPLFDALVNHWLLYQTVSCRLWAKAGFYQAGGATGYRDQLQDAMALAWTAPELLREQILLCASRQFPEGDVQHWWHAPGGAGVRTRFSDDRLWLACACSHYLRATGDLALLDRRLPFLAGAALAEGAEDSYETPAVSALDASVYEHAARAIDTSLQVGAHGLPLIGSGDWNDGLNRVGHEGRGESVWLGWFLCQLVANFAPLARARSEPARALRWDQAAQGWQTALLGAGWDGQWFKRAFFDNGQAFGTHANAEAQIDLIAQAWAVLGGVAPLSLQRQAMQAVEQHLVDHEAGLIKLLAPPLAHAQPSAGYIQAYPGGVRENGGQYSHAGVWALMAQARLSADLPAVERDLAADTAYRYFCYLSPAHRAQHATRGPAYGLEPYVMAGDVYSAPPYVGRGGWSWYTGAAAWMHRGAIESIFGLDQRAQQLSLRPCLPTHWPQAELTLSRDGRRMRFILLRLDASAALAATAQWDARLLLPGQALRWCTLALDSCWVVPLLPSAAAPGREDSVVRVSAA